MSFHRTQRALFFFTLFYFSFFVTGCGDGSSQDQIVVDPPVNVTFSFQSKGQLVAFQLTSPIQLTPSDTLEWDLGDGQTANRVNPVHFYSSPGTYQVTLRLTDRLMRETEQRQTVTITASGVCPLQWQSDSVPSLAAMTQISGGAPGFVMVGAKGKILFSENGFDWCEVPSKRGEHIAHVLWADDAFWAMGTGSYFHGEFHDYSVLLTSADGWNWDWQLGPPSRISTFLVRNQRLIGIGNGREVYVKDPGSDWQRVLGPVEELLEVVWSGEQYLLLGRSEHDPSATDADLLWTSPDGVQWTRQEPGSAAFWRPLASSGTRLVRVRDRMETSTNGLDWTASDVNLPETITHIAWGGGRFVAHGKDFAMASTDGMRWEIQPLPSELDTNGAKLAWNGLIWILANASGPRYWSQDGLIWRTVPQDSSLRPNRTWATVIAHEGGYAVGGYRIVEGGILDGGFIRESDGGRSWQEVNINPGLAVNDIAQTPLGLMAVGSHDIFAQEAGGIYRRQQGVWENVFRTQNPVSHLRHNQTTLIAIDSSGKTFRSENGSTWQEGFVLGAVRQFQVIESAFWALNHSGKLFRSERGISWQEFALPAGMSRTYAFAMRAGRWLVCGDDGNRGRSTWAMSEDLENWSLFQLPFSTSYRALAADDRGFYAFGAFSIGPDGSGIEYPHAAFIHSLDGQAWQADQAPNLVPGAIAAGAFGPVAISGDRILFRPHP